MLCEPCEGTGHRLLVVVLDAYAERDFEDCCLAPHELPCRLPNGALVDLGKVRDVDPARLHDQIDPMGRLRHEGCINDGTLRRVHEYLVCSPHVSPKHKDMLTAWLAELGQVI